MEKSKYYVSSGESIIGVSKVFQYGKTQIPRDVRNILELEDGDRILWIWEDEKIVIKRSGRIPEKQK